MERDIVQQLKDRDEAGAAAFLTHYGPLLRYILGPILPDEQDREECLSEIALRVWDKIESFNPDRGSFTAWLTALARNAALNKARQGKRAASLEDLPPDYPARDPTPEEALLRQERQQALHRALEALSAQERRIWDRDLSGRVLCEMDGETYTAPYYFLGTKSYTNQSIFWGSQSRTAAYAAFSLPRQAENRRGYVCYTIAENVDGYLIDCWVNYIHQDSWLQYPVTGAASPNRSGAFCLAQTALQFYPNEDAVEGSYTVTASQP